MVVTWAAQRDDGMETPAEGVAGEVGLEGVAMRGLVASSRRYMDEVCREVRVLRNSGSSACPLRIQTYGSWLTTGREIVMTCCRTAAVICRTR